MDKDLYRGNSTFWVTMSLQFAPAGGGVLGDGDGDIWTSKYLL